MICYLDTICISLNQMIKRNNTVWFLLAVTLTGGRFVSRLIVCVRISIFAFDLIFIILTK